MREDAGMTRSQHAEVQLDRVTIEVGRPHAGVGEEKRIAVTLSKVDSCIVTGDPDGLRRLVFNLLEMQSNTLADGGHVGVRLSRSQVKHQTSAGRRDLRSRIQESTLLNVTAILSLRPTPACVCNFDRDSI